MNPGENKSAANSSEEELVPLGTFICERRPKLKRRSSAKDKTGQFPWRCHQRNEEHRLGKPPRKMRPLQHRKDIGDCRSPLQREAEFARLRFLGPNRFEQEPHFFSIGSERPPIASLRVVA
jgi:hypothetical protein